MRLALLLLTSAAFGQVLPLGPGLQVHSGGGSSIVTTPGGKCESGTDTCTLDVNTASASLLVVAIGSDTSFTGVASACDADGNAMELVEYYQNPDTAFISVQVWMLKNAPSGIASPSCTLASGTASTFFAQWFSGASTTAPTGDTCTGDDATPCAIDTTIANSMILAIGSYAGSQDTCAGFTLINERNNNAQTDVENLATTTVGNYPLTSCGVFTFLTAWLAVEFK